MKKRLRSSLIAATSLAAIAATLALVAGPDGGETPIAAPAVSAPVATAKQSALVHVTDPAAIQPGTKAERATKHAQADDAAGHAAGHEDGHDHSAHVHPAPLRGKPASESAPRGGKVTKVPDHVDPLPPGIKRGMKTDTVSLYKRAGMKPPTLLDAAMGATAVDGAYYPSGVSRLPGLAVHAKPSCPATGVPGTDGNRVQVLYGREESLASRLTSVKPLLLNELANIDDSYAVSSNQNNGGRRIRWVTDGNCTPVITEVVMPTGTLGTDFNATRAALTNLGFNSPARKYLMFSESNALPGGACGIGSVYLDDTGSSSNSNNGRYAQAARIETPCWATDGLVAGHELTHTLGAVQSSAPHATTAGHCNENFDLMCYADGPAVTMTERCDIFSSMLLDCGKDDYFNVNPPAGSYLVGPSNPNGRWNTARSSFLDVVPAFDGGGLFLSAPPATAYVGDAFEVTATHRGTPVSFKVTAYDPGTNRGVPVPGCLAGIPTNPDPTHTVALIKCQITDMIRDKDLRIDAATFGTDDALSTDSKTVKMLVRPAPFVANIVGATNAETRSSFQLTAQIASPVASYSWLAPAGCRNQVPDAATATFICDDTTADTRPEFCLSIVAADGRTASRCATITMAANPDMYQLTGPSTLDAGTSGTYTAVVPNRGVTTYKWYEYNGWLSGSLTGKTVTLNVPAGTDQAVTVYLEINDDAGTRQLRTFVATRPAFTMSVRSSRSIMEAGESAAMTADTTLPGSVTWSVSTSQCAITSPVASSAYRSGVTLSCNPGYVGPVVVTATAQETSGGRSATGSSSVAITSRPTETLPTVPPNPTVPPTPPISATPTPSPTVLSITASGTVGVTISGRVMNSDTSTGISGAGAQLQRLVSGNWTAVANLTADSSGVLSYTFTPTAAYYYRWVSTGTVATASSVSSSVLVRVPTRLSMSATYRSRGSLIRGRVVSATTGRQVVSARMVLQRRLANSKTWSSLAARTSDRLGYVSATLKARRPTYYRWVYAATSTYSGSVSRSGYLRK